MKNSNSSGGSQGCLTHGWLLRLSFLKPHCLLESFLSTPPHHIFIPQQGSVLGSGLNSCSALVGLAQWHPYNPFRAASLYSLHALPASRGFQHRRRITPGRDVTALCQEWDSSDMALGTQRGEQAQRCTVSLLGNLPRLPHTRHNPEGTVNSGNRIKETYLKWYPTVMQHRKNVCLSFPDDSIPCRELPVSKLPAQHQWRIWQCYHKA